MSQDKIRVLRVIEYSGDRAAVEDHLQRVLYGQKTIERCFVNNKPAGSYTIKAVTLGEVPEILKNLEEQPFPSGPYGER